MDAIEVESAAWLHFSRPKFKEGGMLISNAKSCCKSLRFKDM
jgi:hypothetical protein